MNVGPFNVGLVVTQLQAGATKFKRIAGAAEYDAALKDAGNPSPAAYVLLANEMPRAHSGGSQSFVQRIDATFAVALRIENRQLAGLGLQANALLRDCIEEVRSKVLGWIPAEGMTACELAGAQMQEYDNGVIWWIETFRTTYFVQV